MTIIIRQHNIFAGRYGAPPPPPPMFGAPGCGSIWTKGATAGLIIGGAAVIVAASPKIRHAIVAGAKAVWKGVLQPTFKFIGNLFTSAVKGIKNLFKKKNKTQKAQ